MVQRMTFEVVWAARTEIDVCLLEVEHRCTRHWIRNRRNCRPDQLPKLATGGDLHLARMMQSLLQSLRKLAAARARHLSKNAPSSFFAMGKGTRPRRTQSTTDHEQRGITRTVLTSAPKRPLCCPVGCTGVDSVQIDSAAPPWP